MISPVTQANVQDTNTDAQVTVSIVVPCRNERSQIEAVLQSILDQEPLPGGFEVIVADGMSDDGTRNILFELAKQNSRLRIVDNPDRITARGMNIGILHTRGRYIAIMGAHAHYAPDYLRSSLEVLQETGSDNVGGSMECLGKSWLQRAIAVAHHSPFSVGGARWHDIAYEGPADTVFGGFYRREVFDRFGLFDETLVRNQDDEFNLRLTRGGGTIWQSPRIRSWYFPRPTLLGVFRQYLQYGYWKTRVIRKHQIPASMRHLIPGCFVISLAVLPLLGLAWPLALWIWFGIIGAYLCCAAGASIATAAKHGWSYLPILPIVFACYHLGYGIGFTKGMIDLIFRRVPAARFTDLTRSSARSSPQN
jgi:glycosyltransferase involved in cell wall biosynthesis